MNDEQRAAWRKNEMDQADREWQKIASSLDVIGTFLRDHGDAETREGVAAMVDQATALRERCRQIGAE